MGGELVDLDVERERVLREALRDDEMRRTRRFAPATLVLALAFGASLPLLGGHPAAKAAAYAGIGLLSVALIALFWLAADTERFREWRVGSAYVGITLGIFAIAYYGGILSAAAALVPVAVYFIGIGRSSVVALVTYLLNASSHATVAALIVLGWIPDQGLFSWQLLDPAERIIAPLCIHGIFLLTFRLAQISRRQVERAVIEHAAAVRLVARRDALLEEARNELERALQLGVPGPFTRQRFGSFTLGVVIGRGAMGEVYEAVDRQTGARAAVKLMTLRSLGDATQVARFVREAQVVAALENPHVVRLLEVGDPTAPLPYLAMERLEGRDLGQLLRHERSLPADAVVDMVRQVAAGLEVAHEAGVVHRDIKPQNLFRSERAGEAPEWKILDFGVSKLGDAPETLTGGALIGTPIYMAPEQALGDPVDRRADVYGLAAVAYRALTGRHPFDGKDVTAIIYDVVHRMPAAPSVVADLPQLIDDVLLLGMAKAPSDRFASARELGEALAQAAGGDLPSELRSRARVLLKMHPWSAGRGHP
jgi:serine/threonine-protein kinase